jgi:eukaryotic-like serine/threonine-protein kinase
MAQSFSLSSLRLKGNPFSVAQRILVASSGIPLGGTSAAISASANGVLAYRARGATGSTELVWLDRAGRRIGRLGEPGDYSNPAISPDGKKLAMARVDTQGRGRDLWMVDLQTSAFSRFTFENADETGPVWSPDGSRIAYDIVHNGVVDVYQKHIAGNSEPKVLVHSNENTLLQGWTPDGRYVLVRTAGNVWAVPADGSEKRLGPFSMETPTISPNGRWVAYASNQSGRSEVYVQGFPSLEGKWQISSTGGAEPLWSPDGKELYFLSGNRLVAVPVRTDAKVFQPGAAKPLFEVALNSTARRTVYQVASLGQRFLFNLPLESSSPITITMNWVP